MFEELSAGAGPYPGRLLMTLPSPSLPAPSEAVEFGIDDKLKEKRVEGGAAADLESHGTLARQASAPKELSRSTLGALLKWPQVRGTVYLLLDHSASMSDKGKMEGLICGSLRLFAEARKREYAVGAIGFASRARLLSRASCDMVRFRSHLSTLEPGGRTAMAQALQLATRQLRRQRGDRVIMLVTDGMPDCREAALDAARLARMQGITVIAVGTGGADEAFLAALTPKPELAAKVDLGQLQETMVNAVKALL
jgi:Mg-chelatase subunit ChlD